MVLIVTVQQGQARRRVEKDPAAGMAWRSPQCSRFARSRTSCLSSDPVCGAPEPPIPMTRNRGSCSATTRCSRSVNVQTERIRRALPDFGAAPRVQDVLAHLLKWG